VGIVANPRDSSLAAPGTSLQARGSSMGKTIQRLGLRPYRVGLAPEVEMVLLWDELTASAMQVVGPFRIPHPFRPSCGASGTHDATLHPRRRRDGGAANEMPPDSCPRRRRRTTGSL